MITMSSQRPSGIQDFGGPHQMAYSVDDGLIAEVIARQQLQQHQPQDQIYLNIVAASMAGSSSDISIIPPTPLADDSNNLYSFGPPISPPPAQPQPHLHHQSTMLTFIQQQSESVPSPHSMTGASTPLHTMALSRSLTPASAAAFESNQRHSPSQSHPQLDQNYQFELFGAVTGGPNHLNTDQLLGLPPSSHQNTTQNPYLALPTSPTPSLATTAISDDGSVIPTTTTTPAVVAPNMTSQMTYGNVMPLSIYEPEPGPVSPSTTIMSDSQPLAINMPSSANHQSIISAHQQQTQSHSPPFMQTSASSSSSPRLLEATQSHNVSPYSSTENVALSGDLVRRAHSDVTELSATTIRRLQEEANNIYPRPATATTNSTSYSSSQQLSDPSSSSRVTKRTPGRNSLPSRDGKLLCTICKKWFKKLDDHLWTHSPEPRPHKCRAGFTDGRPTCQYVTMGFARVADRNRHELKHYDGRFVCPFGITNCRIGNERFGRLDTFKRHLRTVHGTAQTPSSSIVPSNSATRFAATSPSGHLAGPPGAHRRHRSRKLSTSDKQLDCCNCNKTYYGVEAFLAHLNDCTYALMHPGEADGSADVGIDDSE
ncbi:hypothetical protein V1509DRAFT_616898 [Lipomyces kononenkoae]